ncbi:amidase signature enzyme [Pleurotus eryngii]|uniref:Amidase signature enzyme n=1 Tax=Pleurotus eryngii TaxID=5323 RepID=A0A9P5ZX83_PLEER|nr:amidase signature enzyme [Pleurotus eryngii]
MKGSPLGIGTIIGCAFCDLYALRPSYERLPYCGASNALEGQESISSVLGPMSNSLSAVKIFTKAIIDGKPWEKDPLAIRKEWSEKEYQLSEHGGKGVNLCFAIIWDNGVVKPHPPLIRAMQMTKDALEAAGHEGEPKLANEIRLGANSAKKPSYGGEDFRIECEKSGKPLITTMGPSEGAHNGALDEPFMKALVGEPRHHSAYELWQLHKEKRELRKSHLDYWESTIADTGTGRPVDAIISPAVAYPAVPHGTNTFSNEADVQTYKDSFCTTLCNAMDYACSSFPVTFVNPKIDKKPSQSHDDASPLTPIISDDPKVFAGVPVVLQQIGRTLEEEGVIAMTEVVDGALKHRT